jgi:threonyl-tRNA synthetase
VQAMVLAVSDRHVDYGQEVANALKSAGLRTEIDVRSESMGRKIADAEHQRIPYILVVGDREVEAGAVSVRKRSEGNLGARPLAELVDALVAEASERRPD